MGASYSLADLMAALEMGCYWWHPNDPPHLWEHDDLHRSRLDAVSLADAPCRRSFVGAYKLGALCMEEQNIENLCLRILYDGNRLESKWAGRLRERTLGRARDADRVRVCGVKGVIGLP